MQVILLEKVPNLGNLGEVVKVKDGFARNFLIPTRVARRATPAAIKAVAFGSVAETLGKQALGSSWKFTGFLATPRNGKHPVLHIQSFQQES